MGGRADPSSTAAEMPGGGVEEARAGTCREGDPHPGERAQHHDSPALPGKASRGEQTGQVPTQPPKTQGWKQDQLALRYRKQTVVLLWMSEDGITFTLSLVRYGIFCLFLTQIYTRDARPIIFMLSIIFPQYIVTSLKSRN